MTVPHHSEPARETVARIELPSDRELPPLTDRGLLGQLMDAAWPHYGGNNQPPEFWYDFEEGLRFAAHYLASPAATSAEQGGDGVREAPTVAKLFGNCDDWGAAEWFERLANAVMEQDKAIAAEDMLSFETYRNIAASSAMELVRGYRTEVRAALAPSTSAATMGESANLAEKALRTFVAHYPMGINPFLDDAFRAARSVLENGPTPPAPAVESAQVKEGRSDG